MQNTNNFEPGAYYHIYNRANGQENLFVTDDNYRYFLKQFQKHISPIANTYAYCLMPNHFHFLICVKEEVEIKRNTHLSGFQNLTGVEVDVNLNKTISNLISQQFSNLFNAYTKAFNKMHERKGSLFARPFKRKQITSEEYLKKVLHYIHFNPVKANLCKNPQHWEFSSYKAILSNQKTNIQKEEVLHWFEEINNFIYIHQEHPDDSGINYFKDC